MISRAIRLELKRCVKCNYMVSLFTIPVILAICLFESPVMTIYFKVYVNFIIYFHKNWWLFSSILTNHQPSNQYEYLPTALYTKRPSTFSGRWALIPAARGEVQGLTHRVWQQRSPTNLAWMSLDCGRKLVNLEEPRKLGTERPNPRIQPGSYCCTAFHHHSDDHHVIR